MGKKNTESDIRRKFEAFGVRLTCYVSGKRKNRFMLDQLKRDVGEGELIKNILDIHYTLIDEIPEIKYKEFTELKEELIKRIKLK